MRISRFRTAIGICGLALGLGLANSGDATAGPAKYDPKTQTFSLTYTYAALPHFGMTPQDVEALGTPQEPAPGQDDQVRALHQLVSQVIFEITGGRAKIGSLEYVKNIKNADIVVSLTGNFNRAGWAISGAIEGRPGQVGLYYLYMAAPERSKEDVVLTVAHELSHYIFSLPDEYSNADPMAASCPMKNPGGPGCLMDNYLTRHGFLALCTDKDHNADGPRQNPGTIVQTSTAQTSCSELVERFFRDHPPSAPVEPPADNSATHAASEQPTRISEDNPFTGRFKRLVESTISFVREQAEQTDADLKKAGKKPRERTTRDASSAELSNMRKSAKTYLDAQLEAMRNASDFVPPTKDQIKQAVELIVKKAADRGVSRPASLDRDVVDLLKTKAKEFATKELGVLGSKVSNSANLLKQLFGDPTTSDTTMKPVIDKIKKELISFLLTYGRRALIGFSPAPGKLSADEQRYIEQIAREAIRGTNEPSEFSTYFEAAKLHIRLSANASETLNAVASELNLPGAENRRVALRDLQYRLEKFALPGKPFTGTGFRRTYIVAPHPLDPALDYVPIDAGERIPYHDIRNLAVTQFMSLLERERTIFLNNPLTPAPPGSLRPAGMLGLNDMGDPPTGLDSGRRFARQVELFNNLSEEILRDRVENIIILSPPGGLTQETGEALETLRKRVLANAGVRVDLVTLGAYPVPSRLRDLVYKSGGTVQTAIDIDETGQISQRLKNDLSSGSWVAMPQQGYIDLSPVLDRAEVVKKPMRAGHGMGLVELRREYSSRSAMTDAERQARKFGLDPFLRITKDDSNEFISRVNLLIEQYFRRVDLLPRSYDTDVRETLTRLYTIGQKLDRIDDQLSNLEAPGQSIQQRITSLQREIGDTKASLRTIVKGGPLFESPLMDTDDYLDYTLRWRLLIRATRLSAEMAGGSGKYGRLLPEFRAAALRKAAYLARRATERDQKVADVQRAIYRNHQSMRAAVIGLPPPDEDVKHDYRVKNQALAEMEEDLERTAISSTPDAPISLLFASHLMDRSIKLLMADDDGKKPWGSRNEELISDALRRTASLLERASRLDVDSEDFSIQLATFRRNVMAYQVAMARPVAPDTLPAARQADVTQKLSTLTESVLLLSQRSERMIGKPRTAASPTRDASGPIVAGSPDESNALSALIECLKSESELRATYKDTPARLPTLPLLSYGFDRGKDDEEHREKLAMIVRYYADELVYSDFPRLLLDMLGHLRMLEDDLNAAKERIFDVKLWRPPFERVGDRRPKATVDLAPSRDPQHIQVTFSPFRAEREANYEIVLGLSRPLRDFEELKKDPPSLRLYRGEDRLEEKPYLDFVPEISTPTMLVFKAPKPDMRAGVIGEGLYTPKILMKRKFFPIVGRQNTIAYTFTVATPRPSVQLIAALRQPQPKDGTYDPTKDPEYAYRGTIPSNMTEAIIEVQVLAGASVRDAEVSGVYQRFDDTSDSIETPSLTFTDDGVYPDLSKGDGVYTTRVTLQPPTKKRSAEYRVLIQARETKNMTFIPLAESLPRKEGTEKPDLNSTPPAVPPFQRATSLNFRVAGDN